MMGRLGKKQWDALTEKALGARDRAYAPYSGFAVGAALLCEDGRTVGGCNVENASYGLSLCAEQNAITTAVAAGQRAFTALVVASPGPDPAPPCGLCLQMLAEFCEDLDVLLVAPDTPAKRTKLSQLLRTPFRWKGAGTAEDARFR